MERLLLIVVVLADAVCILDILQRFHTARKQWWRLMVVTFVPVAGAAWYWTAGRK